MEKSVELDILKYISNNSVEPVAPCDVVEPYRSLLCHTDNMTPVLSKHHQQTMELEVLEQEVSTCDGQDVVSRSIILRRASDQEAVEFGAIRIYLNTIPCRAHAQIIAGTAPLGTILIKHKVEQKACPEFFFRIIAGDVLSNYFHIRTEGEKLFGRSNKLILEDGRVLAEVVEILSPSNCLCI